MPRDLEVFRRLAEKADVVVENFRPDVKARLGIDYDSLRRINPRIVYGGISGFGQDGPYHKHPGTEDIVNAVTGRIVAPAQICPAAGAALSLERP